MSDPTKSVVYPFYTRTHEHCHEEVKYLLGRVLTIVDASITDPTANKAVKDLVKGEFNDIWNNRLRDIILCNFRGLAKDLEDDFGKSDHAMAESPM